MTNREYFMIHPEMITTDMAAEFCHMNKKCATTCTQCGIKWLDSETKYTTTDEDEQKLIQVKAVLRWQG